MYLKIYIYIYICNELHIEIYLIYTLCRETCIHHMVTWQIYVVSNETVSKVLMRYFLLTWAGIIWFISLIRRLVTWVSLLCLVLWNIFMLKKVEGIDLLQAELMLKVLFRDFPKVSRVSYKKFLHLSIRLSLSSMCLYNHLHILPSRFCKHCNSITTRSICSILSFIKTS